MTPYYKEKLKEGLAYQEFIEKKSEERGMYLHNYTSRINQYEIGENPEGIEIKFDGLYSKTGNLFIETAEKTNPQNKRYMKSGIFRGDNSTSLLIGNYDIAYVFATTTLRQLAKSSRIIESKTKTSLGFLIKKDDISKYCTGTWNFSIKEMIA